MFSDNNYYDALGERMGEQSDVSKKYATKETPWTVKHHNKGTSKLRPACAKGNADSSFDSETDHSSSGMEMDSSACHPPPDGNGNLKKQDLSPKSESTKNEEERDQVDTNETEGKGVAHGNQEEILEAEDKHTKEDLAVDPQGIDDTKEESR